MWNMFQIFSFYRVIFHLKPAEQRGADAGGVCVNSEAREAVVLPKCLGRVQSLRALATRFLQLG